MVDRETALALLKKYTLEESQIIHAYCVEETMRRFATEYGHDPDYWSLVGLLHDIDWGMYPDQHCKMAPTLLSEIDVDDAFIHAVVSHGWLLCSNVEPIHFMEKVLYAIDELTGLIYATALMRPDRMVGMGVKSVKKKWASPSFAAGVNREVIMRGVEMLDLPLETVITLTIEAMAHAREKIGL